ncbi:hypothetical protein O181_005849 [Austropuccinia psidii MF-1]|uniref:Multicopper oxidase n=1 Tax=Austropuccinia psidii MF-1 TaxID=1389203 RepID=A0A9Q3GGA0_9BASI|nr:hypothetical protein [Austropuccinia psidii MF-1]
MGFLPSLPSSLKDAFNVSWPWSNSSVSSSRKARHGRNSSFDSRSNNTQFTSRGIYRRRSFAPQASVSERSLTSQSSRLGRDYSTGNFRRQDSVSYSTETGSYARNYAETSYGSQPSRPHRSDETYGQSFTISSRLKRAFKAPTKREIAIGFLILLIIIATLVVGLVIGFRNVSLQDKLHGRINTTPVRTPEKEESLLGHIKGEPPQTREVLFVVDERLGSPDGFEKHMFVVNGQYPGPTIEANEGDEVMVTVKNDLAQPTSIHWKGLFQSGTNYFDGIEGVTECGIPPGEQMVYRFKTDGFSGTTYWRAGYKSQASDGLTGGFVVHPRQSNISVAYDEDVMIQLSDLYHESSESLLVKYLSPDGVQGKPGNEPVPNSGVMNGIGQYHHTANGEVNLPSYYRLVVEPTKSYRLRLANTGSFAPIRFSVESHNLTVVEADGVEVEPVTFSDGLVIEVGQRYSVILHAAHATGDKYWMRGSLVKDQFKYEVPDAQHEILGILAYGERAVGSPEEKEPSLGGQTLDVARLRPLRPIPPPSPTRTYIVNYNLTQNSDGSTTGLMNSTTWIPLHQSTSLLHKLGEGIDGASVPSQFQFVISTQNMEVIDLIIENLNEGSYPFSLNGHRPWLISSGQGRYHSNQIGNQTTANPKGNLATENSTLAHQAGNGTAANSRLAPTKTSQNHDTLMTPPQKTSSPNSRIPPIKKASNPASSPSRSSTQQSKEVPKGKGKNFSDQMNFYKRPKPVFFNKVGIPRKSRFTTPQRKLKAQEPLKETSSRNAMTQPHQFSEEVRLWKVSRHRRSYQLNRRQMASSAPALQRDTFTIPKGGWIRIRFVTDNPGIWLLSDQVQWHLASGAAMQIASQNSKWTEVPSEILKFCALNHENSPISRR